MLLVDAISQHWQHIFSERVLVVPYERVVMDLEGTARDMLSHCRLPWDESVLHFHENLRTVQTASLAQVHHRTGIASYLVAPVIADAGLTVQQCLCFMAAAAAAAAAAECVGFCWWRLLTGS